MVGGKKIKEIAVADLEKIAPEQIEKARTKQIQKERANQNGFPLPPFPPSTAMA